MADVTVLEMILSARYIGSPAFRAMAADVDGLVSSSNGLERAGQAMNALGDVMIGAGVGISVALGIAVAKAAQFGQELTRIQSVTGYTGPQMQKLSDIFMSVSDQYGQSSTDIADGSYFLLSGIQALGFGYNDIIHSQIIPALGAFVEASGAGLTGSVTWQNAAQDLVHVLGGMHVPLNEWKDALGDLTIVENNAGLSQQQLTAGLLRLAPTAALLKEPFAEVTAIIGALATSGVAGARAGTEIAAGYRQMITSTAAQTQLASMGLSPSDFLSATGQIVDPTQMMAMIEPRIQGMKPADQFTALKNIFGATGGRAFFELFSPGAPGAPSTLDIYKNLLGKEQKGDPYQNMLGVAAQQAAGQQAIFDRFKAAMTNLGIVVGTILLPPLTQLAITLTDLATKLRAFAEAHPELVKSLSVLGTAGLLGGGLGMKMGGGLLSSLGKDLAANGAESLLGQGGGLISSLFAAGQAGGAGLASRVGGVGGGIFRFLHRPEEDISKELESGRLSFMMNRFPTGMANRQFELGAAKMGAADAHPALGFLGGATQDIFGGLKNIVTSPLEKLLGLFKGLGPAILGAAQALPGFLAGAAPIIAIALIIAGIIAVVILTFTHFRKEAEAAGATIGKALTPIIQAFASMFSGAWKQIQQAWASAWPQINSAMQQLFKDLPAITPVLQAIGVIIGAVVAVILAVIVGLVNGFIHALPYIIGFFDAILRTAGYVVKFVIDLFTNWKAIPGDVQGIVSGVWGIITSGFGAIVNFIWGFIQGVIGFFQHLWDVLTRHSIIPEMIADIINCFKNLPTQLTAIGIQIVQGLINGIQGAAGNLMNTVGNLAGNVGHAFQQMLGIHSPSAVFYGYGVNTVQGYIGGIASQQNNIAGAWTGLGMPGAGGGGGGGAPAFDGHVTVDNFPQQKGSPLDHYYLARSFGDRRVAQRTDMQGVTVGSLTDTLDYYYRFAYQKTQ